MIDDLWSLEEFARYVGRGYPEDYAGNDMMLYGMYGSFLHDLIMNKSNPTLVEDSFNHFNQFCETTSSEMNMILKVTFFESLVYKSEVIALARKKFTGKALEMFEEVRNSPMFGGRE